MSGMGLPLSWVITLWALIRHIASQSLSLSMADKPVVRSPSVGAAIINWEVMEAGKG